MAQRAIRKERLGSLIAAVCESSRFFGPVRTADGACLAEVSPDEPLVFDYVNFTLPPKHMFFPRSEVIATHEADGMAEAPLPDGKVVLFGVRPCDAMAVVYLDKVFVDETSVDPYYRRRRDNALIIALACREPAATCFCTSVQSGPAGADGADILAVDVGDALLLESVTDAGVAFLTEHGGLLDEPTDEQIKARADQAAEAAAKVGPVEMAEVTAKLPACFDSPAWDQLAERCLGCGICTFLCPTCHCFGLYDEQVGDRSRRVRAQDACMFPAFTLEASGHNPRTQQGARMRQRVMHKFCYTKENFGDIFCVGCGRCIESCPANLDIRETLTEASQ